MRQIIAVDADRCRGCASCIGACPLDEANIAYNDEDNVKVRVNPQRCIVCGACLKVCPSNARYYDDDTERFLDDLKNGEPVALIVAPAFSINFLNWKAFLAWLKARGASVIVDVSLGIDICTWAHSRFIELYNKAALITQPCPPVASYIEQCCPVLLKRRSPVMSPILCTAVYLKNVLKLPVKIAALTPCPAKAVEFSKSENVRYNVTFQKLADHLAAHKICLPKADFEYDAMTVVPGKEQVLPGGLPDNIKRGIGCISFMDAKRDTAIDGCRDNVYGCLDVLSGEKAGDKPVLLNALNCSGGCCNGAGGSNEHLNVRLNTRINLKDLAESESEKARLFAVFDNMLQLNDYIHPAERPVPRL